MKKFAALLMLILCTALCFALPAQADSVTCTDITKLQETLDANANTSNTVTFSGAFTTTGSLDVTVPANVTLVIPADTTVSLGGTLKFTVHYGATLEINANMVAQKRCNVINYGILQGSGTITKCNNNVAEDATTDVFPTIQGTLTLTGALNNSGGVVDGNITVMGSVTNFAMNTGHNGLIKGGTFKGIVTNSAKITGGTFEKEVVNMAMGGEAEISGGTFKGAVDNAMLISGGTFTGSVENAANITGGTFSGSVNNADGGTITGGIFADATLPEGKEENSTYDGAYVTVTFDADGGEPVPASQSILRGAKLAAFTAPVKAGFEVEGWYGPESAATTAQTVRYDLIKGITYPGTALTLKAQWRSAGAVPTVTFNANQGSGTMAPQQISNDAAQKLTKNTFEREGYQFAGWNTAADGTGTSYADEQEVSPTGDITLYAQWKKLHTVTFQINTEYGTLANGSRSTSISVADGDTIQTSQIPGTNITMSHIYFKAWYQLDGDFFAKDAFDFSTPITGDIALMAGVAPVEYTITFKPNGGTGTEFTEKCFFMGQKLPKNTFTRTDYVFDGWNTKADGTGTSYADQAIYFATKDEELYAQWKPAIYTATFEANGGTGTMTAQNFTGGVAQKLSKNTFARTDYVFTGWNTQADGKGTSYTDEQEITLSADTTLYAQWAEAVTVTFDANGGAFPGGGVTRQVVIAKGTTVPEPSESERPTKVGYAFCLWGKRNQDQGSIIIGFRFSDPINQNTTIYARYTEEEYTITYDLNCDEGEGWTQEIVYNKTHYVAECDHRTNYLFVKWNTKPDGTGEDFWAKSDFGTKITADTTLYAQWKPRERVITFNANGGTGTMAKQTLLYETPTKLSANTFTREGYTFTGWNTQADGRGASYTDRQEIIINQAYISTLYAQWMPHEYCTLTFVNSLPGASGFSPRTVAKGVPYTIEEGYTGSYFVQISSNPDDNYFRFMCWNTQADGKGVNYPQGGQITLKADTTLYACWINADYYNHNFTPGSFSVQVEPGEHGEGRTQTAQENKSLRDSYQVPGNTFFTAKGNYAFAGWKIKGADDTVFKPGDTIYLMDVTTTLVAQWQPKTVINVSFDKNADDAAGTMNPQPFSTGTSQKLEKNLFTRTGYTFTGWNTQADGKGTSYTDEQEITLTEGITLYAQWVQNATVTFNANGGTGTMTAQSFTGGVAQKLSKNNFARTDYVFDGWNTQADGKGTSYTDEQEITLSGSITLYAQWVSKDACTITFVTNAPATLHVGTLKPIKAAKGSKITLPMDYREAGALRSEDFAYWFFHCWNTKADGKGVNYVAGKEFTVSGDITLYGVWETSSFSTSATYSVRAEAGDHGAGEPRTIIENQRAESAYTVPGNTYFTANGNYDFAGWKIKGADDTVFKPDDTIYLVDETTTLVAQWQPKKMVNVTFSKNADDAAGTMNQQPFADGVAQKLNRNGFTRTGYTFTGWNTQADGKGTSYADEGTLTLTEDITLYAQWEPKNYTVTFDPNGGTFDEGVETTRQVPYNTTTTAITATPQMTGHGFEGWYEKDAEGNLQVKPFNFGTRITEDITLYAKYTASTYYIRFDANNGTGSMDPLPFTYGSSEPVKLTKNTLTREGHDFVKWATNASGEDAATYADEASVQVKELSGDLTLFAQWKLKSYLITFDGNGGKWDGQYPVLKGKVEHGKTIGTLKPGTDPEKEHYTFEGWYEKDAEGNLKAQPFDFSTQITQEYTLYAKWEPKNYTVTFDPNGGAFDAGVQNTRQITYNNTTTAITATPKKTGHGFAGWYEKDAEGNLKATAFAFATTPITGDITLYARYDINKYTVTFDVEGNKTKVAPQTVSHGDYATKPEGPAKDGHTFDGWYEKGADGKLKDTAFAFTTTGITADITLYAKYTARQYTVTFDPNGGAFDAGVQNTKQVTYNTTTTAITATPKKTGHGFDGWYEKDAEGNLKATAFAFATTPITGDITLYAKYDINKYTVTFDVEGNKTKVAPQTVSHGDYATKPEGPAKDGHTFDGWYVKVNNTFADDPFAFATTAITADITLYAKYTARQYKVTFDANGGTGTMAKQTFTYGVPQKLTANSFSNTCYSFAGWNTRSDGTGDSYTNGQQITLTKDITLYAHWTPLPITVINPQDVVVQEGQSAAFTVQAEGVDLKYQWYLDMGDGFGFYIINGATKPTLSVDDISLEWNGYQFACEVSNEATFKMSGAATLSVSPKPLPPQTGDRSNLTLWLALCAISCAGMAALILHGRKKKA